MKYFIDTEFLEGTQTKRILGIPYGKTPPTIDLISIGIVSEDNRELYLISKDFNLREAWDRYDVKSIKVIDNGGLEAHLDTIEEREYWIRDNVLRPIFEELSKWDEGYFHENGTQFFGTTKGLTIKGGFTYKNLKLLINRYGHTNAEIAEKVKEFCKPNRVYEVVQPITIKYSEIQNPEFYAYYADYDWVVFCWLFGKMNDLPDGFPYYCIDLKQMFDEKEAKINHNTEVKWDLKKLSHYPKQTNEHNALADARWNQELYNFIKSL